MNIEFESLYNCTKITPRLRVKSTKQAILNTCSRVNQIKKVKTCADQPTQLKI